MPEKNNSPDSNKIAMALSGNYQLDIRQVLEDAWKLTRTTKQPILQALLLMFAVALIVVMATTQLMVDSSYSLETSEGQLILNLAVSLVIAPLEAGLMVMGVKHALGHQTKVTDVFDHMAQAAVLILATLVTALLANVGLSLFILPGIFLLVAMSFTILLIADKKMAIGQAVVCSIKVVSYKWLHFFAIYLFFFLLLGIVVMTFGIALIWVAPFYYNAKGVLYNQIFGSEEANFAANNNQVDNHESFDA